VHRRWGDVVALDDVSLAIRPGELVLLAGPSGSGKTTLLRMLAGVLRPTGGTVEIGGANVMTMVSRDLRHHRARCGIVEQGSNLIPQLDVHRNVQAGRLPHMPWHLVVLSAIWRTDRDQVRTVLDTVGLGERQWEIAGNLSGGEQQRVAVARALISAPTIILADEPTSSLDPKTASDVGKLIIARARERKATLVLSSHWLSLVMKDVDRVIGIRRGRVMVDARPDEVSSETLDYLYKGTLERV
jgi:phosphonate transport system ATP-binding protein